MRVVLSVGGHNRVLESTLGHLLAVLYLLVIVMDVLIHQVVKMEILM